MKRIYILFFIIMGAGIVLVASFSAEEVPLSDEPTRIPERLEIVKLGLSTHDIQRTSDEARIPELMKSTPIVKLVTDELLVISCSHGTQLCKLQAIYDFLRLGFEYQERTPDHPWIQSPGETLIRGSGDEMDLAILQASMQRAAGFENEILRGPYHIFIRVVNDEEQIMVDPSCQGCRFLDVRVELRGDEDIFR